MIYIDMRILCFSMLLLPQRQYNDIYNSIKLYAKYVDGMCVLSLTGISSSSNWVKDKLLLIEWGAILV